MIAVAKALVVDQPWIDLLLSGQKIWEMRSKATSHRGWFGLIRKGSGLVVGVARLTGCGGPLSEDEMIASVGKHRIPEGIIRSGAVAKWNTPWFLEDVRPLPQPVPYIHPSGAVTWVNLAESVTRAIEAQVDAAASEQPNAHPVASPPAAFKPPAVAESVPTAHTHRSAAMLGETELTPGNLKNDHFYLRSFVHRFPADLIGGSNKRKVADRVALVDWGGGVIETDIDGSPSKQFFRRRSWVRQFFADNDAEPGDRVRVEETAPYRYRVTLRKAGSL